MSDIKWIKITTDMFDDEKIDFISSLPEGDSLIVVWVRLLTMAGKNNAGGYIFLTENIPFTEDMLAHKFRKPINVIKLALETFERLGMISFDEAGKIMITNWCKHQNVDGMDKVRELTRERVAKHRQLKSSNATCNVTVTESNATELDEELELEVELEVDKKKKVKKNNYSEFVKLTEAEHERLVTEFGQAGADRLIEILDNYKGANGKKYADDNRAIRNWVITRYQEEQGQQKLFGGQHKRNKQEQQLDELERVMMEYDRSNERKAGETVRGELRQLR